VQRDDVLADPGVKVKLKGLGAEARAMTREAFTSYLEKEDTTWIPVIHAGNIRVQ
jgi:tripartite-type tricarboxylate transporter receptor subunit TctC